MRQVTHALLTRPPLSHSSVRKLQSASFDLHVLGTPPAFILSQDQTLMLKFIPVQNLAWLVLNRSTVVFRFCSECSHSWPITKGHFYKNFQGFTYCSVFKVLCCFATAILLYHRFAVLSTAFLKSFFELHMLSQRTLSVRFVCPCRSRTRHILPPVSTKVNTFFTKFFELFQMHMQFRNTILRLVHFHNRIFFRKQKRAGTLDMIISVF